VRLAYQRKAAGEPTSPKTVLEAAWPHLYAAALRHAAGMILAEDDQPKRADWSAEEIANTLHARAHEAAST
jgi:hypothetical protein